MSRSCLDRYQEFETQFGPAFKLPEDLREAAYRLRQKMTIAICAQDNGAFEHHFKEYQQLWDSPDAAAHPTVAAS